MINYKKLSVERIVELLLRYEDDLYYNTNNSSLTEDEYYEIKDYLRRIDNDNLYFINIDRVLKYFKFGIKRNF
jgi:hypothetical protein